MKIKVLDGGYMPRRAHFDDAGLDLLCPEHVEIAAHGSAVIDLKVCLQIPVGYYGKIESKSGLMTKHGIIAPGGTLDSSYRGSIKVMLVNISDKTYDFKKGDKIAQVIIIPCLLAVPEKVDELDGSISNRGENGFGSTGR